MTDKKMSGKQANCCEDSSIAPHKRRISNGNFIVVALQKKEIKEIPIIPITKEISCCSSNNILLKLKPVVQLN